jgi:outer membrane receptor protein involved in Fe transport
MDLDTVRKRTGLLLSSSLIVILAAPASAQDLSEATAAREAEVPPHDSIFITGTRLARDPNATAPSSIVSISADDVRFSGQNDIAGTLRELPALISSRTIAGSVEPGVEPGAGGIGQATLNLRNLGSNRTLVVVNGRRHVSGVAGTQIVDIATIPTVLIESVDVLTGGASAVYGADAVSGVVNFNLRRDFDGIQMGGQASLSQQGDGATYSLDAAIGANFADGRGNIVIAGSYSRNQEIKARARDFSRNNQQASAELTYTNPDRRFQRGDISAAATPNFAQFFSLTAGRFPYGFAIPTAAQFASQFPGVTPTAAEQALIDRALNAPSQAPFLPQPTFSASSGMGLIGRADYAPFGLDLNNNGVPDCSDSYVGAIAFGENALGGCYVSMPGGGIRPFQDGVITGLTNQIGGDGAPEGFDNVSLVPQNQRYDLNLLGRFEFSTAFEVFVEAKYVRSETRSQPNAPNSFYDQLYLSNENPYIPAVLQADANDAGGLIMSRDFYDLPDLSDSDRDTYRVVVGARGAISPNLRYEFSANYGRTDNQARSRSVLPDRLFAAIDVIDGPNGPRCRSDIDNTSHPGNRYFSVIGSGFYTFNPGDGTCRPANLFNGIRSLTPEVINFIQETTTTNSRLEQIVVAGYINGDTGRFLDMPGGAIQFAVGGEYRKEKSRTEFDPLVLGLLPANSPAGAAGTFVGDVDPRQSLVFDGSSRSLNNAGEFDVVEAFGELEIPLLRDRPFFHDLTLNGAARYSDYSTTGGAFTWNVNGVFAPIADVRFRGTYAVAIRAPNISELFSPDQGAFFRPIDPCDQTQIDTLQASGDARAANREANCRAEGIPPGFVDPLTARFSGVTGGNPDLQEETARTFTAGMVLQPRFVPGLTISGDYYSIEIDNAIALQTAQNIVNSCYDSTESSNQYCGLFTRGTNFGFNFLRQTQLNYGKIETAGVEATISYRFSFRDNDISLRATGNRVEKVDRFFDPTDPTFVDPALLELAVPQWAASGSAAWNRGPVTIGYRVQYAGPQGLGAVQIERIELEFGDNGLADETFVHDINFNLKANDHFDFYGGVNNLFDLQPFVNVSAYPVTPVGRFFFVGARARF